MRILFYQDSCKGAMRGLVRLSILIWVPIRALEILCRGLVF